MIHNKNHPAIGYPYLWKPPYIETPGIRLPERGAETPSVSPYIYPTIIILINQPSIYPYLFWGTLNHPLIGCPYHYINPNVPTFARLSTFHDGIPYGLRVIQSWKIPLSTIIRKKNLRRMSLTQGNWLVGF